MKIKEFITKTLFKNKRNVLFSCGALALTCILTGITGYEFKSFSDYETYFWGTPVSEDENGNPNVTRIEHFSDYSKNLKGTNGDADIYVLEGAEEGPSILILGGTHPNEPSGQLTATVLLENLKVNKGTVYIVTETNKSAYTHSYPQEGSPFYYHITNSNGNVRTFKFGSRATNTNDQWPNPDIYVHEYTGQKLSTSETRNMNRAYPGLEDGTFTEQCAYAVTRLIQEKDITLTVDLHEASPEYQTINAMIAHEDGALELAGKVKASMNKIEGFDTIASEVSAPDLHGLTHRELGDHTNTLPMIMETSNAAQGKYRGAFTEGTILYEKGNEDVYYEYIAELEDGDGATGDGSLYARPTTIEERVGRHASCIAELIYQYNIRFFSEDPDSNNDWFEKCFMLDTDTGYDFIDTRYSTTEELIQARKDAGEFDIDFSGLGGSTSITKKNSQNVYETLYNNSIGNYLHD